MSSTGRLFARTSVAYLVVSAVWGVYLFADANHPAEYTSAHAHLLLIGWASVGLVGALTARGDTPAALRWVAWLTTNLGVLAMVTGWVLQANVLEEWTRWVMIAAGILETIGLLLMGAAVWLATRRQTTEAA